MLEGHSCLRAAHSRLGLAVTFALTLFWTASAGAAATLGFVEDWPGISTTSWSGGSLFDNPGTGGFGGVGDGFLRLTNSFATHLGSSSAGPEYTGNWQAAGISHVILSLSNLATNDPIEIHFGIGRDIHSFPVTANFWQCNIGFIPPVGVWKQFDVDLTLPGNFTQTIGTGTFANALQNVLKINLRHDLAPFLQTPDFVTGDVGIDHLMLVSSALAVEPGGSVTARRPVQLAPPAPNPSRGPVAITLESFEGGPVHLQIVDAGGRLVRQAELPDAGAGRRTWSWDGADDRGRRVAPGYYRVRAWGPSGGTSRPFIRVR